MTILKHIVETIACVKIGLGHLTIECHRPSVNSKFNDNRRHPPYNHISGTTYANIESVFQSNNVVKNTENVLQNKLA